MCAAEALHYRATTLAKVFRRDSPQGPQYTEQQELVLFPLKFKTNQDSTDLYH